MKRVTFAMATIATLVLGPAARAQTLESSTSTIDFGIAGGITFPQGDLGDFTGTGWHLMGLVGWQPATMPVGFRFDLTYFGLPGKEINIGGGQEVDGPDARVIAGLANVELDLSRLSGTAMQGTNEPGSASVYLTGGLGVYNRDGDDIDGETALGLNVGAGVNFFLAGMRTFGEAKLHNMFADDISTRLIVASFGVRFGGRTQ
jgi:hypothetical protein